MTILDSDIHKLNGMMRGQVNEFAMKEGDFAG
jgi:hypothetical protein